MNAPLIDDLLDQLRGAPLQQLGQRLGLGPDDAVTATQTALPLLLGALNRNARDPAGATALYEALDVDHRGVDPGNALGTALAGGTQGAGILRHVLGRRAPVAAETVGAVAGIGQERAQMLMQVLAPVVMAYLARRVFTPRDADGPGTPQASPEGLAVALEDEERAMRQREGFGSGLLSMLDRDSDGDVDLGDFAGSPQLGTVTPEMRSPRSRL